MVGPCVDTWCLTAVVCAHKHGESLLLRLCIIGTGVLDIVIIQLLIYTSFQWHIHMDCFMDVLLEEILQFWGLMSLLQTV